MKQLKGTPKHEKAFLSSQDRWAVIDIETDDLRATLVHCIVTYDEGVGFKLWLAPFTDFLEYAKGIDRWVGHNAATFDIPVLNKLLGLGVDPTTVIDTMVLSRLINFMQYPSHSLENIGSAMGVPKGNFHDFTTLTMSMVWYCYGDVQITLKKWKTQLRLALDPTWGVSMRCEHAINILGSEMSDDGFYFNKQQGELILAELQERIDAVEATFQEIWPPQLQEVGSIKYRMTNDGMLYKNVSAAMENYPKTTIRGGDLILYDFVGFNPGSSKDRVDKLWEAGWEPYEKTDTHYRFSMNARPGQMWGKTKLTKEAYEEKKKYFEYYGWTVNDDNLATLPTNSPPGAKALSEWLCLLGRKNGLVERLNAVGSDLRIHARFSHIGAWTHRMSHSNPNLANISSPFHSDEGPKNAVEVVKDLYDAKLREMFCVESGLLVGTDAESIQLRILAHYLRNDEYVHAIVSGRKEDESDIHNLNRRALGVGGITRSHAKTFIYAWLLGAGVGKVARILGCSMATAKAAVESFIASTKGLGELKRGEIRRDANRGYFVGLDGRRVIAKSEYHMLAGYLQNGEAVIMKHANLLWREWADKEKIQYKQVNFVHDEWQTQVYDSRDAAERIGVLQCDSLTEVGKRLNCYCPLSGETSIGHNWLETH